MEQQEAFRDTIGTITKDGKRQWVYPKKPKGKFYDYRTYVSWFLLTLLLVAPFLKIDGNQFLLFNILERRFNILAFLFGLKTFT